LSENGPVGVRVALGEITADRNGLGVGLLGIGEPTGGAVEIAEIVQRAGEMGAVGIGVARSKITVILAAGSSQLPVVLFGGGNDAFRGPSPLIVGVSEDD
jgi:hypothetical protein